MTINDIKLDVNKIGELIIRTADDGKANRKNNEKLAVNDQLDKSLFQWLM